MTEDIEDKPQVVNAKKGKLAPIYICPFCGDNDDEKSNYCGKCGRRLQSRWKIQLWLFFKKLKRGIFFPVLGGFVSGLFLGIFLATLFEKI
jgi:hypothetical protein